METRLLSRHGEEGFTLLEVLVAMVILSIAMLGAQAAFADRLVRDVTREDRRIVALQLAADRVQAIQMEPSYEQLDARWEATETGMTGFPGFTRKTTVDRTVNATQRIDFVTATVTVTNPQLSPGVTRTIIIAAP
jgi:prepilin-type N-terminal cleavage/methylation domain-containing protein